MAVNNVLAYEAVTVNEQKMVSTDTFNIEVQTKVDAVFVCEKYDLVFFVPKTDKGHDQGLYGFEKVEIFKPDAKIIYENSAADNQAMLDEQYPVVRGGEREITLADIHMRKTYSNLNRLNDSDQESTEKAIQGKTSEVYTAFCHFYGTFFTEQMISTSKKTYDHSGYFAPEALHAIAKMYHRPSEKHFDIKNLAIAPKWVNSLMMVIESALRWHSTHSPFARIHLKTIFKTFPMRHVLKEGEIEATLKTSNTEVKISKELQPYQKYPPFPQITDIAQATFVLSCLLNGQAAQHVQMTDISSDIPKTLTLLKDSQMINSSVGNTSAQSGAVLMSKFAI
jgi:hypothetical protein